MMTWISLEVRCRHGEKGAPEVGGIDEIATFEPLVNSSYIGKATSKDEERLNHVVAFSVMKLTQDPDTEGGVILWHMWVVLKDRCFIW